MPIEFEEGGVPHQCIVRLRGKMIGHISMKNGGVLHLDPVFIRQETSLTIEELVLIVKKIRSFQRKRNKK